MSGDGYCQCVREGRAERWHHSPTCPHTRTPFRHPSYSPSISFEPTWRSFLLAPVIAVAAMYITDFIFGPWW